MSTATARAYRSNFADRFMPSGRRTSPEIKPFHGYPSTYLRKAHCIKDRVLLDPCMGSGHILVYMFDVLMQIYSAYGYTSRDAVRGIIENNLYGLDIDDRAAQLAYFSVMMKARQYDARFFSRKLQPHVYAICESNGLSADMVDYFVGGNAKLKKDMDSLITEMRDAKEYGSILNITPVDFDALYARFDMLSDEISMYDQSIFNDLLPFVRVAQTLAQKYSVVCTNPPYMTSYNMDFTLNNYLKAHYPAGKNDLFSAFIIKCSKMVIKDGFQSMITMHSWMFLSRYMDLRIDILNRSIENILHLGSKAFDDIGGEVVQTAAFIIRNSNLSNYIGRFERLTNYSDSATKELNVHNESVTFYASQHTFSCLVDNIIAYWLSKTIVKHFSSTKLLGESADCRQGIATGNNDLFLRFWYEAPFSEIMFGARSQEEMNTSGKLYAPYNKGGAFRRWFGNREYIIKINESYYKKLLLVGNHLPSRQRYYRTGITWNDVSTALYCARYVEDGFVFDAAGPTCFYNGNQIYLLGLLNSKVTQAFLNVICQGLHYSTGHIPNIPFIRKCEYTVSGIVMKCVEISKHDWDSFETSWDFKRHPLLRGCSVAEAYSMWDQECNERFNTLKTNEEELNRIFIDIYGVQDELTPEVEDKDVTVRKADLKRDVRSLISYAVGCMFGRYSLDVEGLAYAGGEWDASKYKTFIPDEDNIIPICDDEYFEDDITGRFVKFIETVYGKETLNENLRFIADALGGSGQPKDVIRSYFLNDFYADHLKIYQKRPIYWLFDSGKKNGFKALIYMHRYAPDTLARMRTDYVHEQQARYRTAIADVEHRMENASAAERVKLNKQLAKLQDQAEEIRLYEEKIHHLADQMIRIDLDDGVKHNYEIFGDVLAKIK